MLPCGRVRGSIFIQSIVGKTMLDSEKRALIACAASGDLFILPEMANRHGLITGATGTGKTVTLQTMAETFSSMGVPVFMALGLTCIAVDRPEHTPPTSSPACACGPADSGHHLRRVVPRCDRKDLTKPTPPFAGPPSPLVSRAALFTSVVTV